jgi:F0F1-type ATP synthase membrane subunit b/b'
MDINPLNQITWWVIVVVPIVFLVVFFVLRRWFVAPYVVVLREREVQAEAARDQLVEAEATLAEAQGQADGLTTAAKERCDKIAENARNEAEEYHRSVVEAAVAEAAEVLRVGRAETEARGVALRDELRVQAVECVTAACERTLGKADPRVVGRSVDRALDVVLQGDRG